RADGDRASLEAQHRKGVGDGDRVASGDGAADRRGAPAPCANARPQGEERARLARGVSIEGVPAELVSAGEARPARARARLHLAAGVDAPPARARAGRDQAGEAGGRALSGAGAGRRLPSRSKATTGTSFSSVSSES